MDSYLPPPMMYCYPNQYFWPYSFPYQMVPVAAPPAPEPAKEPAKESKWTDVNIIMTAFPIPADAKGKNRFRLEQDHFVVYPCKVDIINMTGNDMILALGGGVGSSLQEVYEHGDGQWTLGFAEVEYDSGSAKKKCKEYGWNRAKDGLKRHNTIWVVFNRHRVA